MALNWVSVQLVKSHARGARVLCFGYPAVMIPREHCERMLGFMPSKFVPSPKYLTAVKELPDARAVFEGWGAELTVVDAIAHNGDETLADLNEPHDFGEFDLVVDAGTIEHCFNIGQAFRNMAQSVRVGGRILHTSPVTMLNHGFYNLNPTAFWHFYEANGFEVRHAHARDTGGVGEEELTVQPHNRFQLPVNCGMYLMAKRIKSVPFSFPIQRKYALAA